LTIKKGEKVGIVGETGCGKSTFLDILMGLLEPTKGKIYVDNICINGKSENNLTKSWRNLIAHVPQDIYLSDTTVLNNIAFGIENNQINFDKVRLSARKAKIANFIRIILSKSLYEDCRISSKFNSSKTKAGSFSAFNDSMIIIAWVFGAIPSMGGSKSKFVGNE